MNHALQQHSKQKNKTIANSKPISIKYANLIKSILQPKLKIGAPNDKYEQEADRVADQVMRMPSPTLSSPINSSPTSNINNIQRKCAGCAKEDELIQKKTSGTTPEVTPSINSNIQSLQGGGQPLSKSERSFFEPRFGADLSGVRLHTDSHAASTAQSINAKAFTHGNNVVFGTGEYSPNTSSGRKLLAHELTHVVQQGNEIHRFTTEDCPENINSRISDSVTQGVDMLEKAIDKLEENSVSADVQRHFANHFGAYADWRNWIVRGKLKRVLSVMRTSDIDFECESDCQDAPSNSAYVLLFGILGGTVHLCLPWFRREGLTERAETIIHELFHWHIGIIGDPAYHTNNTSAHTSWPIAVNTPDAYSELVQDIYERTP